MTAKRFITFVGICSIVATLIGCSGALSIASGTVPAPSSELTTVNGTVSNGGQFDIYGTGFGAKTQAAPIRYDDFETGTTVGDFVSADLPWWGTHFNSSGQGAVIANDNLRTTNKTKDVKCMLSTNGNNTPLRSDSIYRDNVGFNITGKVYINFWQYMNLVGNANGTTDSSANYQVKWMDLLRSPCNDCGGNTDNFEWQFSDWAYDSPPNPGWYEQTHIANEDARITYFLSHNIFQASAWYNIAVQIDFGTLGSSNGSFYMYASQPSGAYFTLSKINIKTMFSAPPQGKTTYPDFLRLGWYHGSWYPVGPIKNTFTTYVYYDNIYIDNSWARVEIGDQPTYDGCTHREIQIPVSWDSRHIVVKLNLGSFNSGNVYLYVIDENGVVSNNGNGMLLTVGTNYH